MNYASHHPDRPPSPQRQYSDPPPLRVLPSPPQTSPSPPAPGISDEGHSPRRASSSSSPGASRMLPPGAGYAPSGLHSAEPSQSSSTGTGPRTPPQMVRPGWENGRPRRASSGLDSVPEGGVGGSLLPLGAASEEEVLGSSGAEAQPAPVSRPSMPLPIPPTSLPVQQQQQRSSMDVPVVIRPLPIPKPTASYAPDPCAAPAAPVSPPQRFTESPPPIPDSQSQSTARPTPSPRPSLPLPPAPPSSYPQPPRPPLPQSRNSAASELSQDYALPLQFPPNHPDHILPATTNIPTFVPAPAFSSHDRGPYPPHRASSSSANSPPLRESYYSSIAGMDGPYPSPPIGGGAKGKARESDPDAFDRRASQNQFGFPAVAAANANGGVPSPTFPTERIARVPSGTGGGEFRDSMVGIGRNSIMRSGAGIRSPGSQNLLLGPAPGTEGARQQQQQSSPPPPHLVQQPEVCVECMMRDRDMIDVDVTGDGVWDRESDQDFEEAMRWEEEGSVERGSEESAGGRRWRGSKEGGGGSRESTGGRASGYAGGPPKKKLGRGQPLTTSGLKLWTSMNPPASAHRWRTLQGFLQTQIHLLELERQAREATAAERERLDMRTSERRPSVSTGQAIRGRSSTLLPNGLLVENIDVDRDERQGRAQAKSRSRGLDDRSSTYDQQLSPDDSVRLYASGDQPWLGDQARRFSSPALKDGRPPSSAGSSVRGFSFGKFARSSVDLRSLASPRSLSPGRASISYDDRRGSVWSKFRQSASQSVRSFAPSGSMMDMHLGMSMDKHAAYATYDPYAAMAHPSMSDPTVARHADAERARSLASQSRSSAKPKKKGIKGFFSKLISGGGSARRSVDESEPRTPRTPLHDEDFYDDDAQYLVPPPPLSTLVNEPRQHNRSSSNSSVDSFQQPLTPPQQPQSRPVLIPSPYGHGGMNGPIDRGSILTTGSFTSARSKTDTKGEPTSPVPSRSSFARPSLDYLSREASPPRKHYLPPVSPDHAGDLEREEVLYASVRREKSLPSLPSSATEQQHHQQQSTANYPFPSPQLLPNMPYGNTRDSQSVHSIRTPSLSPTVSRRPGDQWDDDQNDVGGGRKSKARSKVWSMNFGALGPKKKGSRGRGEDEKGDTVVSPAALQGIRREDGLVSVRF